MASQRALLAASSSSQASVSRMAGRLRTLSTSASPCSACSDVPQSFWLNGEAPAPGFGLNNLPFGVFSIKNGAAKSTEKKSKRICTRLGDTIVDLSVLAQNGHLPETLASDRLNGFLAAGRSVWSETRQRLQDLLVQERGDNSMREVMHRLDEVDLHLPFQVSAFSDFYASPFHARVRQFPAWWHQPLGYNGRANSVIVSGQPVRRPMGQFLNEHNEPVFGASRAIDFEMEMGIVVGGPGNALGDRLSLEGANDHIFGYTLLNDWSARDIQGWEMAPLGPFLAKSFATSISPWIVTADALEAFRIEGAAQDPKPLPYLRHEGGSIPSLDISLETWIKPEGEESQVVCKSNFKHVYWSAAQLIAYHSSNGCPLQAGDLLGTGTISGPDDFARGCMAEWRRTGQMLGDRGFLLDNDIVTMRGLCSTPTVPYKISFGECSAQLLPAKP